jgi:hypothetical protein
LQGKAHAAVPVPLKFRKALMKVLHASFLSHLAQGAQNLLESVVFAKVIFGLKISALYVYRASHVVR